jgi:hypothetical protein
MDKTLVESVWKLLLEHIQVVPSALYEEREEKQRQGIKSGTKPTESGEAQEVY